MPDTTTVDVANNVANVSTTRGIAGGYFFRLPRSFTLTSGLGLTGKLPTGSKNLGFIANDGITEAESADTTTETDMNGDAIYTARSNRVETLRLKLVEAKASVLETMHGEGNVTDEAGLITVRHNNEERGNDPYVAELVLKDGRRWRKLIPAGQVTELADIQLNSSTLWGREVTITCNIGSEGDTVIDLMESTETKAGA